MSFNDLGNLLGKILRRFNLKYGEKGISYVFRREDGHYKKELHVTQDFPKICRFLDLDYQIWKKGFLTLESMFDWVLTSRYFSVDLYVNGPDNPFAKRAKGRTTIAHFLRFLEEKEVSKRYVFESDKNAYLPLIFAAFPEANLKVQLAEELAAEKRSATIKQKFNGKLVQKLRPELKDRALGDFIVQFKNKFTSFEDFILQAAEAEIHEKIINFEG